MSIVEFVAVLCMFISSLFVLAPDLEQVEADLDLFWSNHTAGQFLKQLKLIGLAGEAETQNECLIGAAAVKTLEAETWLLCFQFLQCFPLFCNFIFCIAVSEWWQCRPVFSSRGQRRSIWHIASTKYAGEMSLLLSNMAVLYVQFKAVHWPCYTVSGIFTQVYLRVSFTLLLSGFSCVNIIKILVYFWPDYIYLDYYFVSDYFDYVRRCQEANDTRSPIIMYHM